MSDRINTQMLAPAADNAATTFNTTKEATEADIAYKKLQGTLMAEAEAKANLVEYETTKEAGLKQAQATKDRAQGEMNSAFASIGGELGAGAKDLHHGYLSSEVATLMQKKANLEGAEHELLNGPVPRVDDGGPAVHVRQVLSADELQAHTGRLKNLMNNGGGAALTPEEKTALGALRAERHESTFKPWDQKLSQVQKQLKLVEKQLERSHATSDKISQKLQSGGTVTSTVLRAQENLNAADEETKAAQENATNKVAESLRGNLSKGRDRADETGNSYKKMADIAAEVEGQLIAANRS